MPPFQVALEQSWADNQIHLSSAIAWYSMPIANALGMLTLSSWFEARWAQLSGGEFMPRRQRVRIVGSGRMKGPEIA